MTRLRPKAPSNHRMPHPHYLFIVQYRHQLNSILLLRTNSRYLSAWLLLEWTPIEWYRNLKKMGLWPVFRWPHHISRALVSEAILNHLPVCKHRWMVNYSTKHDISPLPSCFTEGIDCKWWQSPCQVAKGPTGNHLEKCRYTDYRSPIGILCLQSRSSRGRTVSSVVDGNEVTERIVFSPCLDWAVRFLSESSNFYNKSSNTTVPLRNPAIGDFCVARFSEDNAWYRARVVIIHDGTFWPLFFFSDRQKDVSTLFCCDWSIRFESKTISLCSVVSRVCSILEGSLLIVFIDYGNSENKLFKEIYPLQESFAHLPAAAVACTLSGVSVSFSSLLLIDYLFFCSGISHGWRFLDECRNWHLE